MDVNLGGELDQCTEDGGKRCLEEVALEKGQMAAGSKGSTHLVGTVESQKPIDASESFLSHDTAINASLLCHDIEEFLEGALESQDFLDIGALRDEALNHRNGLYSACQR